MSNQTTKRSGFKEFFRKRIVSLKRKPEKIAMVVLVIAFLVYSLNLTYISHTTSRIQGPNMGLFGFVTMLLSMLSFVCFSNAYPRRKKPNYAMIALMFVMFAIIFYCDLQYKGLITNALTRADNPIAEEDYITRASQTLTTHMIILGIGAALVLLRPVYAKWIRSIKTSVDVEDNGGMAAIDISGED